ncbi:MAG TPA: CoA pyrophosphatase [Polyangiaceae bacterium]|nr:CoA pyrophosphatase [Polyangiaceae bacterium]
MNGSGARLTEESLREPLRSALTSRAPRKLVLGASTAAAVLVLLFDKDGEAHIWLVRRPTSMRSHAGQVAFPGGKNDASDGSLLITALRETEEELGIARASVDVLGPLDDMRTVTGFTITPWVGWLARGTEVRPNQSEVARAFAPPLRSFLQPKSGAPPWRGWTVEGELVWGATATIVEGLMRLVRGMGRVE